MQARRHVVVLVAALCGARALTPGFGHAATPVRRGARAAFVRLASVEVDEDLEECAVDDDRCLASNQVKIELTALKLFPLDPDLATLRDRVDSLLATPGVDQDLRDQFEEAIAAAQAAQQRAAQEAKAAVREAQKKEERAKVEKNAKAIVDFVDRVVTFAAETQASRQASAAAREAEAKKAAKKAVPKEAAKSDESQPEPKASAPSPAAVADTKARAPLLDTVVTRWWRRRPRRFIFFGKKRE